MDLLKSSNESKDYKTLVFAIKTKSSIKCPQKLLATAQTLKLTRLNQVYLQHDADACVIGKLRSLRKYVTYFILDLNEHAAIYQKIQVYVRKKFHEDLSVVRKFHFGVNSPYKQKVDPRNKRDLLAHLKTYLFRVKNKIVVV